MDSLPFLALGLLAGFVRATSVTEIDRSAGERRFMTSMDMPQPETASLLAKCAGGDKAAFRRLYEINSGKLYGVALRITRQPTLASDAVHDALLQVWRNAARFDPARGNADGWLLSLVRYRALDIARQQRREVPGLAIPEQVDTDPDALARLMTGTEGRALHQCLREVDEPRRALVVLAFIDGLTQSEVAAKVGQPLGTVKSSIRRALLSLRSCLQRTMGPPGERRL